MEAQKPTIVRQGDRIVMPGLATAHSHAFQRALRGRTQRRASQAGSFWSWRGLMYELVEKLDPEAMFAISRMAFAELAMSGVTAIGEFHYVHHGPGGQPYANRTELAEAVINAAQTVGLRIGLIRTAYFRAGYQKELAPAQRRFTDAAVEPVLADVERLMARYAGEPLVAVGLAAHSIRATPREWVIELADYARQRQLPFHMHVAEQRGEIEECLAEYGQRPVELLAEAGVLDGRFVGVHATHLTPDEIAALGAAEAFVCLCRTTERDLGDGLPETAALVQAGAKLCVGVDSHAGSDAFEEVRAVELDDRSRAEARHVAAEAPELLWLATAGGYQASGLGAVWAEDTVALKADDPSIAAAPDEFLVDGVIFGATPRAVDEVVVNGQTIVRDGVHVRYPEIYQSYQATLKRLGMISLTDTLSIG
ncbi:MAG TPA: formimidoylglutamate deiminase [Anaerolineae bacterium]|nr:formimidoylglutamate deiminase [Anaerolineae bacterium]